MSAPGFCGICAPYFYDVAQIVIGDSIKLSGRDVQSLTRPYSENPPFFVWVQRYLRGEMAPQYERLS